jgi:hypothetical protein
LRPRVRWVERRPFVVLNGCHTGERLPETLTDLGSAFVESTGAAGALATEVALGRRLACHLMDVFIGAWARGDGIGAALRSMRWDLLRRGTVMGLAYSLAWPSISDCRCGCAVVRWRRSCWVGGIRLVRADRSGGCPDSSPAGWSALCWCLVPACRPHPRRSCPVAVLTP